MAGIINGRSLQPTIMFNGKEIKHISFNNNDILTTNYKLNDINAFVNAIITNNTDNTNATSYYISNYNFVIDEDNKTITIRNLEISAYFIVANSGTKSITTMLKINSNYEGIIMINGSDDITTTNQVYLSQSNTSFANLLINLDLVFTFKDSSAFYEVIELVTSWVK